jgi:hypothetical protein
MSLTNRKAVGVIVVIYGILLAPSTVIGANAEQTGRFVMRQTENGVLRLDTKTGAISICTNSNNSWSCTQVDDDSAALNTRLRELKAENRKLRDELSKLRAEFDESITGAAPSPRRDRDVLPSDEELDKAFSFLERMLKKFKDLVEGLEDKKPKGTPL